MLPVACCMLPVANRRDRLDDRTAAKVDHPPPTRGCMAWCGSAVRGGRQYPDADGDQRWDASSMRRSERAAVVHACQWPTAWPGGMRQSHSHLGTEERRADPHAELSARERSVAYGRKLRRSVGNGYTEPRQKQFAAGMRRNVAIGGHPQATKRKRYSGTRTRTVLATGAGTRQRRRQCGGRSLCRYIRWTPKAAPTDPKRAPPVCAQLSSVSTRVRHALPRTRVLRRREVQCGGRPEDNG